MLSDFMILEFGVLMPLVTVFLFFMVTIEKGNTDTLQVTDLLFTLTPVETEPTQGKLTKLSCIKTVFNV